MTLKFILLNLSGALYTALTIIGIALVNLTCTCPDLYNDCFWPGVYSVFILVQIFINLLLFHYNNRRNQVQYWTAKSSSLLGANNFGQNITIALNRQFIDGEQGIKACKQSTEATTNKYQQKHEIQSFTKYAICENGTYVDLKSQLWGSNYDDNNSTSKYCSECKHVVPRRCHHCPLCKICVLRKDHHCFLLGGCAGLANQRYFIVFLFWATIGAAYGTSFNFAYLNKHVVHWFPLGWLYYLGPFAMIRWAFGMETAFNMFLALMFSISITSTLGAMGFFIFQMLYTLSGYTMYDYHRAGPRQMESDGENFEERLALIFGQRWWLNFIIPQFWIQNKINEKIAKNIFVSVSKDL